MSQPIGKLVVQHRSAGLAVGTLDGFGVIRCFGELSPEDMLASLKCGDILHANRPDGHAAIVVVDPAAVFPSEATRRAALEVTQKAAGVTLGMVMVILGDGFWASAFRGALTTLSSLSQTSYPRKVVRYEELGVDFAIETLGEDPQRYRAPLLAALAQLKPAVVNEVGSGPPPSSTRSEPIRASVPPPGGLAQPSKMPSTSKSPPSSKRRAG
jgi:hypothetical protein